MNFASKNSLNPMILAPIQRKIPIFGQNFTTMSEVKTLNEFIIERQKDFPFSSGDLSILLTHMGVAAKVIHREVNKAGLAENILGDAGNVNVQGEDQKKLDVYADERFIELIKGSEMVAGIASEENDDYVAFDGEAQKGKYVLMMDPLDGSSNIDVNVSIGTIFSIYRRVTDNNGPVTMEDFLQKGDEQVAGGYIIYGSSTMLVYTTGRGVNGFTLDPSIGEFCLSHADIVTPKTGKIYSVNEGNRKKMEQGVVDYIDYCQEQAYSARYIGSLVADFHRNLLKGGIYIYPGTTSAPNGKLRLLYECNPLAFLIEQAGGRATNGHQRIMEIEPTELHQRVPYFVGSPEMMDKAESFVQAQKTVEA